MSSVAKQQNKRFDWFDEVCQRLDLLQSSASKYSDEDDVLPDSGLFGFVKEVVQDLRKLAGFPSLSTPDVWLGPNGEIGLTWESGARSLELMFLFDRQVIARLTVQDTQTILESKTVAAELKNFAA